MAFGRLGLELVWRASQVRHPLAKEGRRYKGIDHFLEKRRVKQATSQLAFQESLFSRKRRDSKAVNKSTDMSRKKACNCYKKGKKRKMNKKGGKDLSHWPHFLAVLCQTGSSKMWLLFIVYKTGIGGFEQAVVMMLEATTGFQVIQESPVCKHPDIVLRRTTDGTCNSQILHEQPQLKKLEICYMHHAFVSMARLRAQR